MLRIVDGDLDDPRIVAVLERHATRARAETAPGSSHALDLDALRAPEIRFWAAFEADRLAGVGALKRLAPDHGEIKSMHTVDRLRRRGVARRLLAEIVEQARNDGLSRLSLETGSWPYFAPAIGFYRQFGFVECPPFADYRPDPNSVFLSLELPTSRAAGQVREQA